MLLSAICMQLIFRTELIIAKPYGSSWCCQSVVPVRTEGIMSVIELKQSSVESTQLLFLFVCKSVCYPSTCNTCPAYLMELNISCLLEVMFEDGCTAYAFRMSLMLYRQYRSLHVPRKLIYPRTTLMMGNAMLQLISF